ncbi:unnamed protein product [Sordaria macrospora k-hell]|uniref:WGS project CABT00000000 data, contig 2.4 n=1 Tax=Sordaria macrospora (strain ATCC MYA-333 / DSM 997 / K(L3346) / K-hell) TaxID=771870 RepID=F7VR45_SORMK|nr:uncharacterized protein SMAC_01543 [Sordaria macrospora k-hell]CCC07978.1 unnamed protein product [Sordaria macrospora k-hell]
MPLPPETQHLLSSHDFDSEVDEVPREPHHERADLLTMSKSQLIAAFLELQDRADQYLSHIESSLNTQQSQAELLTSIELHLDIPPQLTESHHQHVALDHALTWNEIYGPDSNMLMQTSNLQTQVTTRRLTAIRDHIRESAPQNMLSLKQMALGMSIREFIESFAQSSSDDGNSQGVEKDDNDLWRRMDTPLLRAMATPEMSDAAWNRMGFLGAWFRALRSGHFERQAREKVQTERAVPMVCTECREEKVSGMGTVMGDVHEVNTRLAKAEKRLLEWWRGGKEEVERVVEGMVERFREEDRNEARKAYQEFARSMNTVGTTGADEKGERRHTQNNRDRNTRRRFRLRIWAMREGISRNSSRGRSTSW